MSKKAVTKTKRHSTRQDKAKKNARKQRAEYLNGHGMSKYRAKHGGRPTARKAAEAGIYAENSPFNKGE